MLSTLTCELTVHVVRMPCQNADLWTFTVCVVRTLTCEFLLSMLSEHWPVNFCCHHLLTCELLLSVLSELWPANVYRPCCQNSDLWMFTVHVVRTQTLTAAWCRCCVSRHTSSTTVMPCCWMRGCHSTTSTSSTSSPSSSPWYEGTFVTTLPHHLHTPLPATHTHAPTHTCTLSHTPFDYMNQETICAKNLANKYWSGKLAEIHMPLSWCA